MRNNNGRGGEVLYLFSQAMGMTWLRINLQTTHLIMANSSFAGGGQDTHYAGHPPGICVIPLVSN